MSAVITKGFCTSLQSSIPAKEVMASVAASGHHDQVTGMRVVSACGFNTAGGKCGLAKNGGFRDITQPNPLLFRTLHPIENK